MSTESKSVVSVTPENISTPQVLFNDAAFNDLITAHGYRAWIERSLECPCKVEAMGTALANCQNCNGTGWVFFDKQETILGCMGMTNKGKFIPWTRENAGTISITSKPQDKLGFMDRVTLIEVEGWFSQVLKPKLYSGSMFAFTIYPILDLFDVFRFVAVNQKLAILAENIDYTIVGNKIVLDAKFNNVADLSISIRYLCHPVYHVLDINRDIVKQKVIDDCGGVVMKNLPLNAVGRRAHYLVDAPNYDAESVFDNTPPNRKGLNYNI